MTKPHSLSSTLPAENGRKLHPRPLPADFLFRGSHEILIGHNGEAYRLRITKNGKLILTK